jgi:hypothetical protein
MQGFQKLGSSLKSQILLDLTTLGRRLPDFSIQLKHLLEAADWKMAEELGRITPNKVKTSDSFWKLLTLEHRGMP